MASDRPHLPQQVPIDAYGDGGFRFAGMRHTGSLLSLPSGVYAWRPETLGAIVVSDLALILAARLDVSFVLFGVGDTLQPLPAIITHALQAVDMAGEPMDTGAACRTYNVLLAEGRPVAAALLQVP